MNFIGGCLLDDGLPKIYTTLGMGISCMLRILFKVFIEETWNHVVKSSLEENFLVS